MTFPTYSDLRGLPDPLLQYRWTLIVPSVPGGGDGKRLQLQCQSSSIPGQSNEDTTATSHGIDLKFAGRPMFSHTQQAQFYETRDLIVRDTIRNWLRFARNLRANSGTYKSEYATTAQMLLFDDQMKIVRTIEFDGFFPQTLDDSAVDGSSSQIVTLSATFSYDSFDDL